ncbi:tripartite tricarboxylate transporter substrate binding protein [Cupriavidus taiwanensis]|uniref:Bug family tripartite tricarboxylate transporter substrate binding protein n=1 Tax=Cupriavidus taiwanensis TaxID=164546 RepID=UPI001572F095|nr:tripartite tricarboxylate transporter substrate binding protein [Cupriavidus taiwanensis]NSX13205.1 tripartite tricarboxylate transporter substrate binding protein [Cupriavidus taiwanensis]
MKAALFAGAAIALTLACAGASAGPAYPSRPIRIIVPFTPGSTSDITARAVAARIGPPLGQPVIIENRPGATGALGMQAAARSEPDGYTLVLSSASSTMVPPALLKAPAFDPRKHFTPISLVAATPLLLVARKDSPINSVSELVAQAKRAPGTLNYGSSAGLYQLAMESLNQQAGTDLTAIQYKGPAEAQTDLVGGRLAVAPDSVGPILPQIRSGRMKPLAMLGAKRSELLPDVPTMQELGYRDFDFTGWLGLLAPAGTPPEIITRLNSEVVKAVGSGEVRRQFALLGIEARSSTPEAYTSLIARDTARYIRIAELAGIEKQ